MTKPARSAGEWVTYDVTHSLALRAGIYTPFPEALASGSLTTSPTRWRFELVFTHLFAKRAADRGCLLKPSPAQAATEMLSSVKVDWR